MQKRVIILTCCLLVYCASGLQAQVGPPKPNGPVNKAPVPNKSPPALPTAKSDLIAGLNVHVDASADKVVMDVLVANHGPDAISYGKRTVTLTIKHKGTTYTFFKDTKIPALKGTAATPGQQASANFTLNHAVPVSWGFDTSTVYEVRISPSKGDPQPKNDVVTQTGPSKAKS